MQAWVYSMTCDMSNESHGQDDGGHISSQQAHAMQFLFLRLWGRAVYLMSNALKDSNETSGLTPGISATSILSSSSAPLFTKCALRPRQPKDDEVLVEYTADFMTFLWNFMEVVGIGRAGINAVPLITMVARHTHSIIVRCILAKFCGFISARILLNFGGNFENPLQRGLRLRFFFFVLVTGGL